MPPCLRSEAGLQWILLERDRSIKTNEDSALSLLGTHHCSSRELVSLPPLGAERQEPQVFPFQFPLYIRTLVLSE